jgi:hypothetical protein
MDAEDTEGPGAAVKSDAERQSDTRRRMRAAGFILRQLWVHPADWPAVRAYVERKRKHRAADSGTVQRSKK